MKNKLPTALILIILISVVYFLVFRQSPDKSADVGAPQFVSTRPDIAPASVYKSSEALKVYIKRVTLKGNIPHFNETIDRQTVVEAYIELYNEAGADPKVDKNLWEGIRKGERAKGSIVEDEKLI